MPATLEGYGGYGADQSFMALPTRRTLNSPNGDSESPRDSAARGRAETVGVAMAPGDSMYVRCTFDTRAASNESRVPRAFVPYGVGHGEEMCGQLVYYYPFAADVGAPSPLPGRRSWTRWTRSEPLSLKRSRRPRRSTRAGPATDAAQAPTTPSP